MLTRCPTVISCKQWQISVIIEISLMWEYRDMLYFAQCDKKNANFFRHNISDISAKLWTGCYLNSLESLHIWPLLTGGTINFYINYTVHLNDFPSSIWHQLQGVFRPCEHSFIRLAFNVVVISKCVLYSFNRISVVYSLTFYILSGRIQETFLTWSPNATILILSKQPHLLLNLAIAAPKMSHLTCLITRSL